MGARISSGFTIIETMLFLAVTGLLVMGVLIGTGASLANQRYKDSVETFKNTIQTQYAELGSVKNDRSDTWDCGTDATPVPGGTNRGQSKCLVVGRYMVVDRSDISIYTVLAYKNATAVAQPDDITTLKNNYTYNVAPDVENKTMDWGAQIAWPSSGTGFQNPTTPRRIGVFILRSPESGRVYTFTQDFTTTPGPIVSATFTGMMLAGTGIPGQGGRTLCVESGGGIFGGDRAVYIQPKASGSSSVEVRSNATITLLGDTTQC